MYNYRLPRNQSRHRVAAIALFRALLTQCRAIPALDAPRLTELQNLVRNRFKQSRHEHSIRRLKLLFQAGYEAIDHLDEAVAGNKESKSYILSLLLRAPEKAKQTPYITLGQDVIKEFRKQLHQRPNADKLRSVFDRPLPKEQLSGERHVPVLFNAQGIPVLRFSKPQPPGLSAYINGRLRWRQKRHNERHRLGEELVIAEKEDAWDGLMQEYVGSEGGMPGQEGSWAYAVMVARQHVSQQLENEKKRNQEMAEKMQAIVDKERELYEAEKAEKLQEARAQGEDKDSVGEAHSAQTIKPA